MGELDLDRTYGEPFGHKAPVGVGGDRRPPAGDEAHHGAADRLARGLVGGATD